MKRRKPIKRSALPARKSRPKATNAYMRPEWRKLVAKVKQRSRGLCEAMVRCQGNPAEGDPHHLSYRQGFVGWKRLLVDLDQLQAVCRPCHLELERRKDEGTADDTAFLAE